MSATKSNLITPRTPDAAWLKTYLEPSIIEAAPYKIDTPAVAIKLDQNESPWDWPKPVKDKILAKLGEKSWNRYPEAFTDELADKVAAYAGIAPGTVLLGPGSNYLISLILTVLVKGYRRSDPSKIQGKLVIARPSFALYESHCKYEGLPYTPWNLTNDLEYDIALLPELTPGSMVVFASPNNPVGNVLAKRSLIELLKKHPQTLFIADEAYFEYTDEHYADLLQDYANLILVRTFSKTLGCAGVRIGYIAAHQDYLAPLRKLRLPFLMNHFSIAVMEVVLEDAATQDHLRQIQTTAVRERERVFAQLSEIAPAKSFTLKNSAANFILARWPNEAAMLKAYRHLIASDILVRNVSAGPGLQGCLRLTMGTVEENEALVAALASS